MWRGENKRTRGYNSVCVYWCGCEVICLICDFMCVSFVCVCVCVSARFLLSVLATLHSLDSSQLADRLPELPGLNS